MLRRSDSRITLLAACWLLLMSLGVPRVAAAQDAPEAPAPASSAIDVRVELFGVADRVRPGSWAGLRVALQDNAGQSPRDVVVRLHVPDPDGDTLLAERSITLSPGVPLGTWLYAVMPWSIEAGSPLTVSVHPVAGERDGVLEVLSAEAAVRVTARKVADASAGLIGIIGQPVVALKQFEQATPRGISPTAHENTVVENGIETLTCPDRWMGWEAYRTIVWTEGDPGELGTGTRSQALREWVHRGGHLVVVLPAIGSGWFAPSNPLIDLMPSVRAETRQDVRLQSYRPLLTKSEEGFPERGPVTVLRPEPDTPVSDATVLMSGSHGPVVVRRLVGAGAVTLVGLDLTSRRFARGDSIQAEVFWNSLLGRRQEVLTGGEMSALGGVGSFGVRPVLIDELLGEAISKQRAAGVAVLVMTVVFIVYFVIAGPGGYALLKWRSRSRFSWLLYAGTALVMGIGLFIGAGALRPKTPDVRHLTFLDHVYGQQFGRVRAYTTALLPAYGSQTFGPAEQGGSGAWTQAVSPWGDAEAFGLRRSFPDARSYAIEARDPDSLRVPSRATTKQFRVDWLGGRPWSTPIPASAGNEPAWAPGGRMQGILRHDLPAALDDVRIVMIGGRVRGVAGVAEPESPGLPREAYTWTLASAWEPGADLDLSDPSFTPEQAASMTGYLGGSLVPPAADIQGQFLSTREQRIDRATFYPLLRPPDDTVGTGTRRLVRRSAHGLDKTLWLTQPGVLIIGTVRGETSPIAYNIDGREVPVEGETVVRWFYPLPEP
ncbi:MAG: hypothetical protein AAGD00_09145 [Planctomycetota bacterium]